MRAALRRAVRVTFRSRPLFGGGEVAFPLRPPDDEVAALQVDVGLLQGDDLAAAKAGVTAQQDEELDQRDRSSCHLDDVS